MSMLNIIMSMIFYQSPINDRRSFVSHDPLIKSIFYDKAYIAITYDVIKNGEKVT